VKMPLLAVPAMAPLTGSTPTDSTTVGPLRTTMLCSCKLELADVAPRVNAANSGELVSSIRDSFCRTWSERLDTATGSMPGAGISYETNHSLGPPEVAATVSVVRPVASRNPACTNAITCVLFAVSRLSRFMSCHELHNLLTEEVIVMRKEPATFCSLTPTAVTPAPLVEAWAKKVVTNDVVVIELVVVQVPWHVVIVEVTVAVVGHIVKPQF